MLSGLSDAMIVRIVIGLAFLVLILYIVVSGKKQGEIRRPRCGGAPWIRRGLEQVPSDHRDRTADTEITGRVSASSRLWCSRKQPLPPSTAISACARSEAYEKIIMLYLAAKSGQTISGAELVLATEKVGLNYGHHNIYHRLVRKFAFQRAGVQHGERDPAGLFRS